MRGALVVFLASCAALVVLVGGARAQTVTVLTKAEFGTAFPSADNSWPPDNLANNQGNSLAEVNALPGFSDRGVTAVSGSGWSYWANADYPATNTGPTGKPENFTFISNGAQVFAIEFTTPQEGLLFRAVTNTGTRTLSVTYTDDTSSAVTTTFPDNTMHAYMGIQADGLLIKRVDLLLGDAGGNNQGLSGLAISNGVCTPVPAPATPTLNEADSGIVGDDLVLAFDTAGADRYTLVGWAFPDASAGTCDDTDGDQGELWSLDAALCNAADRHTLTVPLTSALAGCGFSSAPQDGGDVWFYESVLEATTSENASSAVFGDEQSLTTVTSFRLRVEFPKDAAVNGSAGVFGPVIDQSALTEQTFDSLTQEFGWNLATSVQYPYYLEPVSTAVSGGHAFDTLPVVATGGNCAGEGTDAAPAACRQDFALSANETDDCFVPAGTTVTVTFQILCRPQYAGSCDLPEGNTTTASFSVETDDFCPQVVEVASITPSLTTYAGSAGGTVSTNYILETTLFGRVTADVEAGLQAKRTTLTGLDIVSACTGCGDDTVQPFTDGLSAAATAYDFVWEDGGRESTAAGEVQTDFQFTLNTNALSFDNDATTGEAQITLTAYVSVEYDTPSAQGLQRSYRVQAVSGPGSIGSSASANFGVSSAPAGGTTGGSSSTAGSTVLGVSTGTAALAAVGLAVVAAVAFGAAVSYRRRQRRPGHAKASSSSSSASLELGTAAAAATSSSSAVPAMATGDLRNVQGAYGQVAV